MLVDQRRDPDRERPHIPVGKMYKFFEKEFGTVKCREITTRHSGGVFYDSYNLEGPVDEVIPVDVYVPGCPPRPEAIIHGVVKAWEKLERLQGVKA